MAKRKRKTEVDGSGSADGDAATQNGDMTAEDKLRLAVFGEREKLHRVRLACGQLKRIADPGPEHIHTFVKRIFDIVGERGA